MQCRQEVAGEVKAFKDIKPGHILLGNLGGNFVYCVKIVDKGKPYLATLELVPDNRKKVPLMVNWNNQNDTFLELADTTEVFLYNDNLEFGDNVYNTAEAGACMYFKNGQIYFKVYYSQDGYSMGDNVFINLTKGEVDDSFRLNGEVQAYTRWKFQQPTGYTSNPFKLIKEFSPTTMRTQQAA